MLKSLSITNVAVAKALDVELPDDMERLRGLLEREGIDATIDNGIAYAMIFKALSGDRQAVDWVRETSGDHSAEQTECVDVVIISGEEDIPD